MVKAPCVCIVHFVPTRSDGVCQYCENKYWYEEIRLANRAAQAQRISDKLIAKHESDIDEILRRR